MSEQWDQRDALYEIGPLPRHTVGHSSSHSCPGPWPQEISRHDFFAGMALNGMISHGMSGVLAVELAWDAADLMVKHR